MTTSSSRKTYDTSLIGPQRRGLYSRLKLHKQTGLYTTNSCWLLKTGTEEDPGAYIQQGGLLLRQFLGTKYKTTFKQKVVLVRENAIPETSLEGEVLVFSMQVGRKGLTKNK